MGKIVKSRHWGMVVYPESVPDNWVEVIKSTGVRCAISPLHDRDIKVDGSDEDKKAHWHVVMCWEGPTTYNAAKEVTDKLNAPIPQKLSNVRGYYRYFTHADDPDKFQYDPSEIKHLNGFDPADYIEWTRSEHEALKRRVMQIIRDTDMYEYADLLEMLADSEANDLLSVAMNNTILFRGYIASRANRRSAGREQGGAQPPSNSDS